ncbi:MAG: type II CAAX endopeptidase family protein [candidate division Zixibacteria bacterium]|nr:type II CAAX endopeptidase family protein [candidate division Zixibacteria bacterium]
MKTACAAGIFYIVLTVAPITAPYAEAMLVGILLYYGFCSNGENELGLGWPLSRSPWNALIVIAGVTLVLLAIIIFLFGWLKLHCLADPITAFIPLERAPLDKIPRWAVSEECYTALANMNIAQSASYLWQPFVIATISAPIGESVTLFGMLFPALFQRYGYGKALTITSLLFMILHLPNYPIALAFILASGFVDCILYVKTRSLYPTIIFHSCWNLVIFSVPVVWDWGLPEIYGFIQQSPP